MITSESETREKKEMEEKKKRILEMMKK